jgi:hypothetical protein
MTISPLLESLLFDPDNGCLWEVLISCLSFWLMSERGLSVMDPEARFICEYIWIEW